MSHSHTASRSRLRHPSNGGAPSIPTDLGTGVLSAMRINSDIDEIKPRLALRAQLPLNPSYTQGDQRMRVVLCARHGHRLPHIDSDFSFDVPVDVDMHEETPSYSMSKLTKETAREHGYANANDMRKSLGFRKGEDGTIFSYRLLSPPIPENDLSFARERARLTRGAYEAFRGAKGDNIIFNRRTGVIRESREPSIQRARDYLKTLPRHAALIAEASITPRSHLEEAELVPFAAPPMHTRKSNGTQTPREVPTEVSALRAPNGHTLQEPEPQPEKTPRNGVKKTKPPEPAPVQYATDYGSRGQYTDKVERPKTVSAPLLSAEQYRAVKHSKMAKARWRDRVARAAFGVGEEMPPEPPLFKSNSPVIKPRRSKPLSNEELQRRDHLAEEGVPLEGPFTAQDYMQMPRDDKSWQR